MEVVLTLSEVMTAAQVGVMRQVAALKRGLPDRHGIDPEAGWGAHVEGACGEMALAKALGRYWSGSVNTFRRGGDVGSVQVRTRSRRDYELIVRPDDRDGDAFVLVVGTAPRFVVVGWAWGSESKFAPWGRRHGGRPLAYFVPQDELRAIETLPAEEELENAT